MAERAPSGSLTGFRPGWRMTLFAALLLPLVVSLGFWQLSRAEEKRGYEDAYLDRLAGLPLESTELPMASLVEFQRIRLHGRFEPGRDFLVDNQTRSGAVGYTVVTSFLADDDRRWLLNRGFIVGDRTREALPVVATPDARVSVVGVVWPDLGLMPMFSEDDWPQGWPKLVQRLEVPRMARLLDNAVPLEIRLEAAQPGVFIPPLLEMNMPASKHMGYAVQWFGLAIALSVGYVVFGFKRHD